MQKWNPADRGLPNQSARKWFGLSVETPEPISAAEYDESTKTNSIDTEKCFTLNLQRCKRARSTKFPPDEKGHLQSRGSWYAAEQNRVSCEIRNELWFDKFLPTIIPLGTTDPGANPFAAADLEWATERGIWTFVVSPGTAFSCDFEGGLHEKLKTAGEATPPPQIHSFSCKTWLPKFSFPVSLRVGFVFLLEKMFEVSAAPAEGSSLDRCRSSFLNDAGVLEFLALRELVKFITGVCSWSSPQKTISSGCGIEKHYRSSHACSFTSAPAPPCSTVGSSTRRVSVHWH